MSSSETLTDTDLLARTEKFKHSDDLLANNIEKGTALLEQTQVENESRKLDHEKKSKLVGTRIAKFAFKVVKRHDPVDLFDDGSATEQSLSNTINLDTQSRESISIVARTDVENNLDRYTSVAKKMANDDGVEINT